jgi:hypothetical protein
MWKKQQN